VIFLKDTPKLTRDGNILASKKSQINHFNIIIYTLMIQQQNLASVLSFTFY